MQCQLCSFNSTCEKLNALEKLKEQDIYDHLVCANNFHFKQLCDIQFKDSKAKNPLNFNDGGNTRYFSINFTQYSHYYDFFNEIIVADFLKTVDKHFVPDGGSRYQISRFVEILNYDSTKKNKKERKKSWGFQRHIAENILVRT